MTLYQLPGAIEDFICQNIDPETGELLNVDGLMELELEKNAKTEGLALHYKNSLAESEMLKNELAVLTKRKRVVDNTAERMKELLKYVLNGEVFKTSKVAISYRKSTAVNIEDIAKLDRDFLKYSEPTADKTAIKKAIQAGLEVEGAVLVENTNISIK